MPPIPVHIDKPITAQKVEGVTPQTEDKPTQSKTTPTSTTTEAISGYPAAKPGQAAVPAPTPYVAPQPTRTQPSTDQSNGPPPPQPGAAPMPPNTSSTQQQASSKEFSIVPPQRVGESIVTTLAPPPSLNQAPTHSTTTANPPAPLNGPTTLNFGAVVPPSSAYQEPASHPPGYRQDVFAQELSPAQRASLEEQTSRERGRSFGSVGGAGGVGGLLTTGDNDGGGASVWDTVKSWTAAAASKAAAAEEEVWKRINDASK